MSYDFDVTGQVKVIELSGNFNPFEMISPIYMAYFKSVRNDLTAVIEWKTEIHQNGVKVAVIHTESTLTVKKSNEQSIKVAEGIALIKCAAMQAHKIFEDNINSKLPKPNIFNLQLPSDEQFTNMTIQGLNSLQ